jgi:hypothetical protein
MNRAALSPWSMRVCDWKWWIICHDILTVCIPFHYISYKYNIYICILFMHIYVIYICVIYIYIQVMFFSIYLCSRNIYICIYIYVCVNVSSSEICEGLIRWTLNVHADIFFTWAYWLVKCRPFSSHGKRRWKAERKWHTLKNDFPIGFWSFWNPMSENSIVQHLANMQPGWNPSQTGCNWCIVPQCGASLPENCLAIL